MRRAGMSLVELATVLTVVGLLALVLAPRVSAWVDRLAVARSVHDISTFYRSARLSAIYRAKRIRVFFGIDSLTAVEEDPDSVVIRLPGPGHRGVSLRASRQVIRLYPNGSGLGGANTKIVLARGSVAESLTISRLGRLKRWP